MTIRIYPSLLPGEPIETHEWASTLGAWMQKEGIDYLAHETQPIQVSQNDRVVPVERWVDLCGDIEIRLLPHGSVFKALGSIIGKIFNAVFGWLMPNQSGFNRADTPNGKKLEVATAKANQARLGEVVPELAGRFRRFPDYLTPPRRYFSNLREQWLEFHACIGPGRYQIDAADVKVGDTPFSGLGVDGQYQIFLPGVDLSTVSTHEHWHTVGEVGGTSSGTAGLVLPADIATTGNVQPPEYTFGAHTITRSSGNYPAGWGYATQVYVEYPRNYDVATIHVPETEFDPAYDISEITGYFGHLGAVSAGDSVSLGSYPSQTVYKIRSISGNVMRLETTTGDPLLITPGNQNLVFGVDIARSISSFSEQQITVGGGAFVVGSNAISRVIFAGGLVYGDWTSTFAACPASEKTTLLELDFFFPGGLAVIKDDGTLDSRTVRVEVQYRDMAAGGAFTSVTLVYTQATLDQIGFSERFAVTSMRPEVRVRRVGATANDTQIQDKIHWYGLKSRLPTVTSYPNWTTMMIRLRSGGRIAAQSENQINVVATRIFNELQSDGTWGAAVPTRDISAFVKRIASSIGYGDSDIDMAELLRLHNIWKSRGETLDYVFEEMTVREALNVAFGAGMAELTVDHGQIRPVRDDVRTQFEQPYSPQNMTKPLRRTFRAARPDDHDGVEVEYVDGTTWTSQTVVCLLPGDQGFKLEKLKLDGVTDRTRAWRMGMRRRRQLRYRNWDYAFATEMDALNSSYLSYVPLYDDLPGYGKSAILEHIEPAGDDALLHVSEPLEWEEGASHVIGYRKPDGSLAGPFSASPGPDEYSVIADIPTPWPTVSLKQEPPHIYFGTAERWCFPALITQIAPQGLESANVTAVNYDVRVYADDNNSPPE